MKELAIYLTVACLLGGTLIYFFGEPLYAKETPKKVTAVQHKKPKQKKKHTTKHKKVIKKSTDLE